MAAIQTTTALLVLPLVTCRTCEQAVPQDQAHELYLIEYIGRNAAGIKQFRPTGEIAYECRACWDAYFDALEAGEIDEEDGGEVMAQGKLTKDAIRRQMTRIERATPENIAALQAGAQMLGREVVAVDGGLLYQDVYYPDFDELTDDLLTDLQEKMQSL